MAGAYPGARRGGINVSAYLQNLNTIPSADEQANLDTFNPDDLDLWTNTQFFDFDMGQDSAVAEQERKPSVASNASVLSNSPAAVVDKNAGAAAPGGEFDSFLNGFPDFSGFDDYSSPAFADFPQIPVPIETPQNIQTPIAPNHAPKPVAPVPTPSNAASPPAQQPAPRGSKRKATSEASESPQPANLEEASRLAAEEDKRRRNTAASARFRVKKKQKEQQLEKTAKEMTERVSSLEQRIQQLEMENKWLKNLIVEKNGGKSGEEMFMPPPSILSAKKDGVGTP